MFRRLRLSLFWKEALLFGGIQGLGIVAALQFLKRPEILQRTKEGAPENAPEFLFLILLITALFVVLLKIKKTRSFLRFSWFLALFGGLDLFLNLFFPGLIAFLLSLGALLLYWRFPTVWVHNALLLFSLPAVGALFGLRFSATASITILIALSLYDIFAVYISKHMVFMARTLIEQKIIPGIIVTETWQHLKTPLSMVRPHEEFAILGSGDLVFPILLSANVGSQNLWLGIAVLLFSLCGLFITHLIFVFQKERRPIPALPPIAFATILGYLIINLQ